MSGLDDLLTDEIGGTVENHPYRTYPYNEFEDTAWEWFEKFEDRFPCEIQCDFIEVSPNIESARAKACYRDGGEYQFIRFAKWYVVHSDDWALSRTLMHEMMHLYCYQRGHHNISDSSPIFKWLCGAVGCHINEVDVTSPEWIDLAEEFAYHHDE